MEYNFVTKGFTITERHIKSASYKFINALRYIRKMNGLPLDRYHSDGVLTEADQAMKGVIDGAKHLGINLGAEWGNELDLRNADEV